VRVTGNVDAFTTLSRLFDVEQTSTSGTGVAQKRKVEIMMVLDRSGSMDGSKMINLRTAAKSFIDFFATTQAEDRMGLISFSFAVRVDRAMGNNFVSAMKTAIDNMNATGATNTEDAIDQSDGPGGFRDQTNTPPDQRLQQFLIFFSDGMPTAFRNNFRYRNQIYDAVGVVYNNCTSYDRSNRPDVVDDLYRPDTGSAMGLSSMPTGDGLYRTNEGRTPRTVCTGSCGRNESTTRWTGVTTTCCMSERTLYGLACDQARSRAVAHAQELKDHGIKIYCIGLGTGSDIDPAFLRSLSSGSGYTYITPDSNQLRTLFQEVAKQIKLRLVE
jgi:hypothetical protein